VQEEMNNLQNWYVGIISNIVFEPYFSLSIRSCFGENVRAHFISFGEQCDEQYYQYLKSAQNIIVWLNIGTMFPHIWDQVLTEQQVVERVVFTCNKLYVDLQIYNNRHILWFLFEDYFINLPAVTGHFYNPIVDKINIELNNKLKDNITFVDLKRLIAEVGVDNAYDIKNKYRWNAPYSKSLIRAAVKEIYKQNLIEKGITKKCLVIDCDNVLWGGILSEDGIENISLSESGWGRFYKDFQRILLSLYYRGVVLAICSKNDWSDIRRVFNEHSDMLLKEKHIACFQVNWEDKPSNIRKISEKLNISLDSMAFLDDSPMEIEAVKTILPEVTTILFNRDMNYNKLFSCFSLKSDITAINVENRNVTYQTNEFRDRLRAKYVNYSDYIKALAIKIDIHEASTVEYGRISELTQRTNKCTNGKRYTVSEIKERVSSGTVKLYSVFVADCFSDLGLVGAVEIERNMLTLFSLSCRALGREVEREMVKFIKDHYQISGVEYYSVGKNEAIKTFLMECFSDTCMTTTETI